MKCGTLEICRMENNNEDAPLRASSWVRSNCVFAAGLPPINPGLNLDAIADEVVAYLKQVGEGEVNVGNMLRALALKGRDYKAIRKRASEMGVDFFALVTDRMGHNTV